MNKLYIILLSVLLLSSCATYERKELRTRNFLKENPRIGAEYCNTTFPVNEILIPGKPIVVIDTFTSTVRDTVWLKDGSFELCPPGKIISKEVLVRDTIRLKDSASIFLSQEKIKDLEYENLRLKANVENTTGKLNEAHDELSSVNKKLKKYFWFAGIGAGAFLIYIGMRLKRVL